MSNFLPAGIHDAVPMARYLADPCERPSLNAGIARTILTRSSLHAWHEHPRLNAKHTSRETDHFDIGTAAHSMVIEGVDAVVVVDFPDWRTKDAKTARFAARAAGKVALLKRHYDNVCAMVDVAQEFIGGCELSGALLEAKPEQTCIWQEEGFYFRSRPDWTSRDRRTLVNYKTCDSAEPSAFIRLMPGYGYDLSSAFYEWGMRALGYEAQEYFLAQETEPPYACSLIGLSPAMRDIAERKRVQAVTFWKHAVSKNQWRGYPNQIHYAEPAAWQIAENEERLLSMDDRLELGGQG